MFKSIKEHNNTYDIKKFINYKLPYYFGRI